MLLKTKAFSVWGSQQESRLINAAAGKSAVSRPVVHVGGRKISITDIAKVSCQNGQVVLDDNLQQEVNSFFNQFNNGKVYKVGSLFGNPNSFLPVELCRSALFHCISVILQGKSAIRYEVAHVLTALLNSGFVPRFTSVENTQAELLSTIAGQYPFCSQTGDDMVSSARAFQIAGIDSMDVFEIEALTLLNGELTFPGMVALITHGAASTLRTVDVISSFSCESVNVSTAPFDADLFDIHRPHRGQMASASNLRLMLESSSNVTRAAPTDGRFSNMPQVHGPAGDLVANSARCGEHSFCHSRVSLSVFLLYY
jgi:hypothetical protein